MQTVENITQSNLTCMPAKLMGGSFYIELHTSLASSVWYRSLNYHSVITGSVGSSVTLVTSFLPAICLDHDHEWSGLVVVKNPAKSGARYMNNTLCILIHMYPNSVIDVHVRRWNLAPLMYMLYTWCLWMVWHYCRLGNFAKTRWTDLLKNVGNFTGKYSGWALASFPGSCARERGNEARRDGTIAIECNHCREARVSALMWKCVDIENISEE